MDQILQMILEIVREQQRDATDLRDTMTKAEVVELTMSMMEQQGVDEYHEDLEADIYHRIQYLAPRLFEHEDAPQEPEVHMEKFSYRVAPTEEALLKNENLNLDHMVGDKLQGLDSPVTIDTLALDYEQAYTHEGPIAFSEPAPASLEQESPDLEQISSINSQLSEVFQDVLDENTLSQTGIDEEALNRLVMEKYMELSNSDSSDVQIDSTSLASLVMQALKDAPAEITASIKTQVEDRMEEEKKNETVHENEKIDQDEEDVDSLLKEIWGNKDGSDNLGKSSDELGKRGSLDKPDEGISLEKLSEKSGSDKSNEGISLDEWNKKDSSDKRKERMSLDESGEKCESDGQDKRASLNELGEKGSSDKREKGVALPKMESYLEKEKQKDIEIKTDALQEKMHRKEKKERKNFASSFHTLSGLYNTKTYMEDFSNYLKSFQKNRPVLTGFSSIDRILETGLHKGLYWITSDCIDVSSFCLQLADKMAMKEIPVCYFLFYHSRYECMAKTLSRLTYELRGKENAYTLSSLYQKQEDAKLDSIQTELKYYEDKIAPNLYFVETNDRGGDELLANIHQAVKTIEQAIGQKPVVLFEDIFLDREGENSGERAEFLYHLESLCDDLEIISIISANRLVETKADTSHSYIQIKLTELPEQDSFTKREILLESGESLLLDVSFMDGSSHQEKKCQLFSIPKFYCFESR